MKTKLHLAIFALATGAIASAQTYSFTPFFSRSSGFVPWGLAVGVSGDVYAADFAFHSILKISSVGAATTFAGATGLSGIADGIGSAARFGGPNALKLDGAGNLYVADTENHTIRKITPEGVVTTLAGAARQRGGVDGAGEAARFFQPIGIAVDRDGNVYVADGANHAIRKIAPSGVVSTFAGSLGQAGYLDGAASTARFAFPFDLALDSAGNLFVVDYSNGAIRKVTPDGNVTTLAKGLFAMTIAVDRGGNVYVEDGNSDYGLPVFIRRITQAG
ncbi:MAG: hypothetical protein ABIR80_00180, partial [Opitutaceae bacterium]